MADSTATEKKTVKKVKKIEPTEKSAEPRESAAAPVKPAPVKKKPVVKKRDWDPHEIITVRNGFQGRLIYVSKKTGERFVWDSFGDEQDMELAELRNARNSAKSFFTNNWFLFDDMEVVDYLGVSQYYKYALTAKNFDSLFTKTPEEAEETISRLSAGQKKSVAYRARQLIQAGEIDSNKMIATLEKCLGVALVER